MTRPFTENHSKIRYVRAAYRSGILERKGAQTELARILDVSRSYLGYLLRVVKEEEASEAKMRGRDGS